MATRKAKKFVSKMLENDGKNGITKSLGKIAIESGYSKAVARSPKRILQSQGVVQLFKEAGIDPTKIAEGYNDLMKLKLETNTISVDQRRKLLHDLKEIIIDDPEQKTRPQYNFISKFLNINALNKKPAEINEPEIIEE